MAHRLADAQNESFISGEDIIVRVQTKDSSGTLAAPTSLTYEIEIGTASAVTYTLGTDSEIETIATGDYQVRAPTVAATTDQQVSVVVTAVSSSYTLKEVYVGMLASNPVA